jgi:TPR repeat protein
LKLILAGFAYERGIGVVRNKLKAAKWYLKAAESGLAEAQNNIGVFFELGIGVTQDSIRAGHWYKQAAEQGIISPLQLIYHRW